jgi:hypothetical protein
VPPGVVDDEHDRVVQPLALVLVHRREHRRGRCEEPLHLPIEHRLEDCGLIADVLVDRGSRDSGPLGDRGVQPSVDAGLDQALRGSVEDAFAHPVRGGCDLGHG